MFGLRPSAPTRPEDYAVDRAGRPLGNTRVKPRGLTPRRLAQLAGAVPRARCSTWRRTRGCPNPPSSLGDVVAGPEPWMGMLLDPALLRPVPIGMPGSQHRAGAGAPLAGVARRAAAPGASDSRGRIRGPWPRFWTSPRWPTSPASSTEAAAEAAIAEQGDGPLDIHVIECAVAGGFGGDAAAADAVTASIAETIRQRIPKGGRRAAVPRAPSRRAHPEPAPGAPAGVPMVLTAATRAAVITRRGRSTTGLAQSRGEADR